VDIIHVCTIMSTLTFSTPSDVNMIFKYFVYRFKSSINKCINDRYFKANIVYLIYSILLVYLDRKEKVSGVYVLYILLGYIHILNAILYMWMWSEIRSVWDVYILPDWLNIVGMYVYIYIYIYIYIYLCIYYICIYMYICM
jgi:hypothetical protein